jgi:hypothetical protein
MPSLVHVHVQVRARLSIQKVTFLTTIKLSPRQLTTHPVRDGLQTSPTAGEYLIPMIMAIADIIQRTVIPAMTAAVSAGLILYPSRYADAEEPPSKDSIVRY